MQSLTDYDNSRVCAVKLKQDLVNSQEALFNKLTANQKYLRQCSKAALSTSEDTETRVYNLLLKLNGVADASILAPLDNVADVLLDRLKGIQNEVEALMISKELTAASRTQLNELTVILAEYAYTLEVLNLKHALAKSGINIARYMHASPSETSLD